MEKLQGKREQDIAYEKYVEDVESGVIKCDYFGMCDGMTGMCVDCSEFNPELWKKCSEYKGLRGAKRRVAEVCNEGCHIYSRIVEGYYGLNGVIYNSDDEVVSEEEMMMRDLCIESLANKREGICSGEVEV